MAAILVLLLFPQLIFTQTLEIQLEPRVGEIAWSPDDTQILAQYYQHITVYDATTGEMLLKLQHTDSEKAKFLLHHARWSPDGTKILTASLDMLKVWEVETGMLLATLHTGDLELDFTAVDWDESSTYILRHVAHEDKIAVWSLEGIVMEISISGDVSLSRLRWDMAETEVYGEGTDWNDYVWDAATGELLSIQRHDGELWNADKTMQLGVLNEFSYMQDCGVDDCQHRATVYNLEGSELLRVEMPESVYAIWSTSGNQLAVGDHLTGTLQIWSIE